MTLTVGSIFPWPEWYSWLPKSNRDVYAVYPQLRPEPAIIFAADSRWTYDYDKRDFADGAIKVAAIDDFGAAAYAGNSVAGERALMHLGRWMRDARNDRPTPDFREGLQRIWRRYRTTGGNLTILLGFFDREFEPHLFRTGDSDDFEVHDIVAPEAIGVAKAADFFHKRLRDVTISTATTPRVSRVTDQTPDRQASLFQAIIFDAGRKGVDRSVGGPPLSLIVSPSGLRGCSVDILDPATGRVVGASLSKDQAAAFYGNPRRRGRPHGVDWFYKDNWPV